MKRNILLIIVALALSVSSFAQTAGNCINALVFPSDNANINFGNFRYPNRLETFTLEAWVFWTGTKMQLFNKHNNQYFAIESNGKMAFNWGNNPNCAWQTSGLSSTSIVPKNQWVHVAFRQNGMLGIDFFINGVVAGRVDGPHALDNIACPTDLMITGGSGNKVAELRFWASARSNDDIKNNMATCFTGSEANLWAHCKFEGPAGAASLQFKGSLALKGTLNNFDLSKAWVMENVNKCTCPIVYNPAAEITFNNNPFGPWDLGYGTTAGDWNRLDKFLTRGTGGYWNASTEDWKGVYFNPGATDMVMSGGFVVKNGMLVMHPGNKADHLSKIRFTAPEDGNYKVNVTWTAIDDMAKKTSVWVLTNASSVNGAANGAMKEVFTKGITGFNGNASYEGTMTMKKGQQIYFEVGNGGDTYTDDALEIKLTITK